MSRHKFVRDLDYDDYYDYEDEYEEDDNDQEVHPALTPDTTSFVTSVGFAVQKKISQSQRKAKRNAIALVREIVGDVDPNAIRIAVEQSNLDVNAAAAMLLDGAESKPAEPILFRENDVALDDEPPAAQAEEAVGKRVELTERALFGDVRLGYPSVASPISVNPSALAQSLSAQLDIKSTTMLPSAVDKSAQNEAITPFMFDVPSPDTAARSINLKAAHAVAITSTPKNEPEQRASSPKPPKGLSETALRKRKALVRVIAEREQKHPSTNICMIVAGHVDAGKSTLMGHFLYLLGEVSSRELHKFEKDSREQGKSSFKYAWVLDTGDQERSHGVTVDIATKHFSTDQRQVALLDAPGHRDYVPNMIAGASQADCALLVVDAVLGEFESGFDDTGQTKEHAVLLKSFGIGEIVVVVNKLDMVGWSRSRYQDIVDVMDPFLKGIGFRPAHIRFVPCSGLEGANLVSRNVPASLAAWYQGPTLLEMVDTFTVPQRQIEMPLRAICFDVFKSQLLGGITVAISVLQGCVFDKDRVLLLPSNQVVTVKGVSHDGVAVDHAQPGQRVDIGLIGVSEDSAITIGSVLSDIQEPLQMALSIHATIVTLDSMSRPILPGSQLILHAQSLEEPCTVSRLRSLLNKATGDVVRRHPRLLTGSQRANLVISLHRPIGVEPIEQSRQLGRFSLRREGRTVAVGVVKSVNKQ